MKSSDKGKEKRVIPSHTDIRLTDILKFGKLEFNYSREMTLDPKRSGHI